MSFFVGVQIWSFLFESDSNHPPLFQFSSLSGIEIGILSIGDSNPSSGCWILSTLSEVFALGKYISKTLNSMISKHIRSVLVSSKSIKDQPWFNNHYFEKKLVIPLRSESKIRVGKYLRYFHEYLVIFSLPQDIFGRTIVIPKNSSSKILIRLSKSFINFFWIFLLIFFRIKILILKDIVKHLRYFCEYLSKSISPRDLSRKVL